METLSATKFALRIRKGEIIPYYEYFAGWMSPDGKVNSVDCHVDFVRETFPHSGGYYRDAYDEGYVRLALYHDDERKSLVINYVHPPIEAQKQALITMLALLDTHLFTAMAEYEQTWEMPEAIDRIKEL